MNTIAIGENVRRLRTERNITQQQLADAMGVSFQAVSKWENSGSLPDVATLPQIADFFEVTIDDLFRPNMTVYKNKAQRLMTMYECDQDNSEAFERAQAEYQRLFDSQNADTEDISGYAYLNDCRARYYNRIAERNYLQAITLGAKDKKESYYKDQRQYILFLSRLGRSQESIQRHRTLLEQEPDNPMYHVSLLAAYQCAGDLQSAYAVAEKALLRFPNNAMLLVYAGDTCKGLGRFDQAREYWDHSFSIDPEMIDTRYSLAMYLTEQGRSEEAHTVWQQIIDWNERRGFLIESRWARVQLSQLHAEAPSPVEG